MKTAIFKTLSDGVHCIDALYTAPDIACCYLICEGDECALIETGTARSVDNILATLDALNIHPAQLRFIVPTHVHLDHAGGAGALMQIFPNAELLIHPRGARHMLDPARLIASSKQVYGDELFNKLYGEIVPVDASRLRELEDGARFQVGGRNLEILHTRGHADHHFCIYDSRTRGWFSGDMFGVSYARQRYPLGSFIMPATTPTQFEPALYRESIQRLAARQPRYIYLTHFGALLFSSDQVDRLLRQLDAYANLAESFDGDIDTLETQLSEVTAKELSKLINTEQLASEVSAMGMDLQLNAQGIAWWSQHAAA